MNDKLFLRHKINILPQYIYFLNFIHPNFEIINNLDDYDNPLSNGIIYIGKITSDIEAKLNNITNNWIIISNSNYDIDLSTNEGLIKNTLPLYYLKLKNVPKKEVPAYNNIEYTELIEQIKLFMVSNKPFTISNNEEVSVYRLYASILASKQDFDYIFFNIVNSDNINLITSSVLTFLNKVMFNDVNVKSVNYARLIEQSHRRYGKYLKQGIKLFLTSKCNKEISLYNLLSYLNQVR